MARRVRSVALVGRTDEVALLDRLAGTGTLVVVRGESGIGKSRLLAEVAARLRTSGSVVLTGRAVEGGGAYRPLADALLALERADRLPPPAALGPFAGGLADLLPGWGTAAPATDRSLLVSEALLRLLRLLDRGRGAAVVLDDLQWADADTLQVLDRLTDATPEQPLLLVLAARPDAPPALERLAQRADHVLALGRLSPLDADALAAACGDGAALPDAVRRHVVEHAEGLPLLVEELLGALADVGALVRTAAGWEAPERVPAAVPASFAAVVHARLSGLDAAGRRVVDAAAVVGRSFSWSLLPAVTGLQETVVLDALRVAVDRGLVVPEDASSFRFAHALVREAVVERLLPPQRAALAREAARVVDESGDDPALAAQLHEQAGEPARAATLLVAAAERAGAALGTREQLLRRALVLRPDDVDATVQLVDVLAQAGRARESRELGDPLLARLAEDDARRARLALVLARACLVEGARDDADRYLTSAGAGPAVDVLAAQAALARRHDDAAQRLALAAAAGDDAEVRCAALGVLGQVARRRDRLEEAERAFVEALQVAEASGLALARVQALHELGTLDLLGPARGERLVAARALAVEHGLVWTAAVLDVQLMALHALRMEHEPLLAVSSRGADLAASLRLPALEGATCGFAAMAHAHLRQEDAFAQALQRAERLVPVESDHYAQLRYVRGTPAMLRHDLPAWLDALRAAAALPQLNPGTPYTGQRVLLETVLGDGAAERAWLRASGGTVQGSNRGALAYADAVAAARAGDDPGPALALAERVMAPLAWRRHHARLLVAPRAVADGWGEPVAWLREATDFFTTAGEADLARAARDALRAAGAPVPRRGRGDSEVPEHLRALGVTSREVDVLRLVVEGLPNAEVARRLFLSPRTVETHVANLLAKTGARSRTELRSAVSVLPAP